MEIDKKLIRETFKLAELSVEHGNQPFGSLLAKSDGTIVLIIENGEITKGKLHHAELDLVDALYLENFSDEELADMTLYTSTEPCVMCTGAIAKTKIRRVVYGCSGTRMSEIAKGGSLPIPCNDIFSRSKYEFTIIGPFLQEEAEQIHLQYWPSRCSK